MSLETGQFRGMVKADWPVSSKKHSTYMVKFPLEFYTRHFRNFESERESIRCMIYYYHSTYMNPESHDPELIFGLKSKS